MVRSMISYPYHSCKLSDAYEYQEVLNGLLLCITIIGIPFGL